MTVGTTDGASSNEGSSPKTDGGGEGEDDASSPKGDAGSGSDAKCVGPIVTTSGETCIGFGPKSETCDPSCGQPYGFYCANGAPPGFTGCREQRVSIALGNTYCCPTNGCVAQPDQDPQCASTAGKPHRFQCPPAGDKPADGGNPPFVTPPNGCVEKNSGSTELEKFYCCP